GWNSGQPAAADPCLRLQGHEDIRVHLLLHNRRRFRMTEQESQAEAIIGRYVKWSVGSGLIPIPLMDLAAVTAVQIRMLSKEADLFGVPFSSARAKAMVTALMGSVVPSTLAY